MRADRLFTPRALSPSEDGRPCCPRGRDEPRDGTQERLRGGCHLGEGLRVDVAPPAMSDQPLALTHQARDRAVAIAGEHPERLHAQDLGGGRISLESYFKPSIHAAEPEGIA